MSRHNKNSAPSRHSRRALSVTALAVASALWLSGCGEKPAAATAPQALPVTVVTATPQTVPYTVEVMAQTEGAKEAEVRARVGGILEQQLYQEGDRVKAGQPLFRIDQAPFKIALAEAQARARQTSLDLARMKKLIEVNGVSHKEYDDAVSANDLAQAQLNQAQLNLSWTTVTAPVAGISGRALKSVGNLVTVGSDSLLTTVYQNNPIWVRFSLADNEIAKLPGGVLKENTVREVDLILADGSVYPHKGRLNFLASSVDTVLGTRQLRAEFPNPDDALLPGQFVRARLLVGERKDVFLIPQTAIIQDTEGDLVMVANPENRIEPRPIKTAEWHGTDWLITAGLKSGDRVIVDNLLKLRPGNPVAPHAAGAAAPQGQAAPKP